jgi:hypothetical protein
LPDFNMAFDPRDLSMISCLGWPDGSIEEMRSELAGRARSAGGKAGRFWWSFPKHPANVRAMPA